MTDPSVIATIKDLVRSELVKPQRGTRSHPVFFYYDNDDGGRLMGSDLESTKVFVPDSYPTLATRLMAGDVHAVVIRGKPDRILFIKKSGL